MAVEYNQHTWGYGEELTPDKLNNIEGGVKATAEAVNEVNNNLSAELGIHSLKSENCTITSGGYVVINNVVIINIRISNDGSGKLPSIKGFPKYSGDSRVALPAMNYITTKNVAAVLQYDGTLISHDTSAEGVIISGCYIKE